MNLKNYILQANPMKKKFVSDNKIFSFYLVLFLDIRPSTGWRLIEGKYYFFSSEKAGASYRYHSESARPEYLLGRPYGSMYEGEKMPNGYEVDEEGAWKEKVE